MHVAPRTRSAAARPRRPPSPRATRAGLDAASSRASAATTAAFGHVVAPRQPQADPQRAAPGPEAKRTSPARVLDRSRTRQREPADSPTVETSRPLSAAARRRPGVVGPQRDRAGRSRDERPEGRLEARDVAVVVEVVGLDVEDAQRGGAQPFERPVALVDLEDQPVRPEVAVGAHPGAPARRPGAPAVPAGGRHHVDHHRRRRRLAVGPGQADDLLALGQVGQEVGARHQRRAARARRGQLGVALGHRRRPQDDVARPRPGARRARPRRAPRRRRARRGPPTRRRRTRSRRTRPRPAAVRPADMPRAADPHHVHPGPGREPGHRRASRSTTAATLAAASRRPSRALAAPAAARRAGSSRASRADSSAAPVQRAVARGRSPRRRRPAPRRSWAWWSPGAPGRGTSTGGHAQRGQLGHAWSRRRGRPRRRRPPTTAPCRRSPAPGSRARASPARPRARARRRVVRRRAPARGRRAAPSGAARSVTASLTRAEPSDPVITTTTARPGGDRRVERGARRGARGVAGVDGQHVGAHRRAGELGAGLGRGHAARRGAPREQPVGGAGRRVEVDQHERAAPGDRGQRGRERRVAAEGDDGRRPPARHEDQRAHRGGRGAGEGPARWRAARRARASGAARARAAA